MAMDIMMILPMQLYMIHSLRPIQLPHVLQALMLKGGYGELRVLVLMH
jgi:hypothetical protein